MTGVRSSSPVHDDPGYTIHVGDVLDVLGRLRDGSAQTCVTSPPYWGRRGVGIELNPAYADLAEKRIQAAVRPNTARTDEVVEGLFTNAPSSG